ncbi:MAG: helix-turn-helix domain-containing protein [Steroidobacteraceae bacterium]|jgi:hypothetical protein
MPPIEVSSTTLLIGSTRTRQPGVLATSSWRIQPGGIELWASRFEGTDVWADVRNTVRSLGLDDAAAFLRMHPEEVRSRAKRGVIPGAKIGRSWVFLESDLAEFVRSLYPVRRQALRVTSSQEATCHYANADRSGGSTFGCPTDSEYVEALRPKTKAKPKNS